nr:MAG TPA: hypothetical protein [Caudoviricetes sp.]
MYRRVYYIIYIIYIYIFVWTNFKIIILLFFINIF